MRSTVPASRRDAMRSWISSSFAGAAGSGTTWRVSHAAFATRGGTTKRTCVTGPSIAS